MILTDLQYVALAYLIHTLYRNLASNPGGRSLSTRIPPVLIAGPPRSCPPLHPTRP